MSMEIRTHQHAQDVAYVYVVECEETKLYKIGWSRNTVRRMAELQAGSAFSLEMFAQFCCVHRFAPLFEAILHERFASKRAHGEWFKLDSDDLSVFEDEVDFIAVYLTRINYELKEV